MALIIYGINHKTMTTSITKCRLCFQNWDFLKLETFFLKCRLFSKWRQGDYILIQSLLWWPRSPSATSSQKRPEDQMHFVFSVNYISMLDMGAVAYSSTPVDLVLFMCHISIGKFKIFIIGYNWYCEESVRGDWVYIPNLRWAQRNELKCNWTQNS